MDRTRGGLPVEAARWIKADLAVLVVFFLLANPTNAAFVEALGAREWTLWHLRDAAAALSETDDVEGVYDAPTGSYERAEKNAYFGAAEGKNLIVVQLESFQNMVVGALYDGQEITPRINAWIKEQGILYFDNFYQQGASGNTSDAEFAVNNSMIGAAESYTYKIYEDNYFRGLPKLLAERGYDTLVMHGYDKTFWNREKMYPEQGFARYYSDDDYVSDEVEGLGGGNIVGISDEAFYEQSARYLEAERENGPFYAMLISLSSHHPFMTPDAFKELEILPRDVGSTFANYLNAVRYADRAFGLFIDTLKENGLYDESLIVVYGDHQGLIRQDDFVPGWLGREYEYDRMMNMPLIISLPGSRDASVTRHLSGGQTDVLPTLAWLLGFETLDTYYIGQNLLTAETGFVPQKTHLLKGSFIKDDVVFEMSRDGIFENSRAWRVNTGEPLPIDGMRADMLRAKAMIETGDFCLKHDILRKIYTEGRSFERVLGDLSGASALPVRMRVVRLVERTAEKRETEDEPGGPALLPGEFIAYMNAHPDVWVAVECATPLATLTRLGEQYSGRASRLGVVYVRDAAAAKRFSEMQRRMLPVVRDVSEWTKIEYLGYADCALAVSRDAYDPERLATFIEAARPAAAILPEDGTDPRFLGILNGAGFIYGRDDGTFLGRVRLRALGADGILTGE